LKHHKKTKRENKENVGIADNSVTTKVVVPCRQVESKPLIVCLEDLTLI